MGGGRAPRLAVVGLGSNPLIADDGFDGVAIRLAGELATVEPATASAGIRAGGGASLAVVVRRAASWAGRLRVRLRHPRHRRRRGADERGRLRRRDARRAGRGARRARAGRSSAAAGRRELDMRYRGSNVGRARWWPRRRSSCARPTRRRSARSSARCRAAAGRAAAEGADVRQRLAEPGAGADGRAAARAVRPQGLRGRRRADLARARQLHREHRRRARRPT